MSYWSNISRVLVEVHMRVFWLQGFWICIWIHEIHSIWDERIDSWWFYCFVWGCVSGKRLLLFYNLNGFWEKFLLACFLGFSLRLFWGFWLSWWLLRCFLLLFFFWNGFFAWSWLLLLLEFFFTLFFWGIYDFFQDIPWNGGLIFLYLRKFIKSFSNFLDVFKIIVNVLVISNI